MNSLLIDWGTGAAAVTAVLTFMTFIARTRAFGWVVEWTIDPIQERFQKRRRAQLQQDVRDVVCPLLEPIRESVDTTHKLLVGHVEDDRAHWRQTG